MMKKLIFVMLITSLSCKSKIMPSQTHTMKLNFIKSNNLSFGIVIDSNLKPWTNKLVEVYYKDQYFRDLSNSEYYKVNSKKQNKLDNQNQVFVSVFLDSFGYRSANEIGVLANRGVNLTLDHASINFKRKYLPIIEKAFSEKKISPIYYAIFVDKYLAQNKKFQKYGTQIIMDGNDKYLFPVDVRLVNIERRKIGLVQNLSEYLEESFNMNYDSILYLKILPSLVSKFKVESDF